MLSTFDLVDLIPHYFFLNIFRFCSRNEKLDIFEIYVTLAYSKSTICKDKNSSIIPKFKLKKEGRIK